MRQLAPNPKMMHQLAPNPKMLYLCTMEKTEARIQQEIYVCLSNMFPSCEIIHIPNEMISPSPQYINKMKAIGTKFGAADLIVCNVKFCVFVEVKRPTKTQSPNQLKFESRVVSKGMKYFLYQGLEEQKNEIINYIKKLI